MHSRAGEVPRTSLVERLARARIGLIESPSGYGKTTLLRQVISRRELATLELALAGDTGVETLLAQLSGEARRRGLTSWAEALTSTPAESVERLAAVMTAGGQPVVIAVDEVQRSSASAAEWLAGLGRQMPPDSGLLLAGRRMPERLARLQADHGVERVTTDDLRFTRTDVAQVLLARSHPSGRADDLIDEVLALTDGWPAAVVVAASTAATASADDGESSGTFGFGAGLMGRLVDTLLRGNGADDVARLGRLATLPLLDDEVGAIVAGDRALRLLRDSGVPFAVRSDGWMQLPDAVRDELARYGSIDVPMRRAAASVYARRGLLQEGITLLHAAKDQEGLAALLADQPRLTLGHLGVVPLRTAIGQLDGEVLAAQAMLLVNAARTVEMRDPPLRTAWLEQALAVSLATGDAKASRAATAELARDAARAGDGDRAEELAHSVVQEAGPDEATTRARALVAWAIRCTVLATPRALAEAEEMLTEAIALFRMEGEPRWEADAWIRLGYSVSFHAGRLDRAVEQLASALALLPVPDYDRGVALAYLPDVFDLVGRTDEAEAAAREGLAIGRRLGDPYVIGQAAWAGAGVTARRGDRDATMRWLEHVDRHPGRWLEQGNGAEFLAWAADALAALGDEDGSRHYLARAAPRVVALGLQDLLDPIVARIEACFGDARLGDEILARLDGAPFAVERARYARRLIRAFAARRCGDEGAAGAFAGEARHEADLLELPGVIARTEPWLSQQLADLLDGDTAAPSSLPPAPRITMLGGFAVASGALDVTPPPGHASRLLKLVALRGPVTVDEAVEMLWPEVGEAAGRSRMRNLLNRLRTVSGDVVVRQADGLVLAAGVEVDAHRFDELAISALRAPEVERVGMARLALELYRGELLPGDRYEDWVSAPRERLQRRYLTLIDLVAAAAHAEGNLDDAIILLDEAIKAEPLDDSRYVTAARALVAQGRRGSARDLVQRALDVAGDLGVEPGVELRALAVDLGLGNGGIR